MSFFRTPSIMPDTDPIVRILYDTLKANHSRGKHSVLTIHKGLELLANKHGKEKVNEAVEWFIDNHDQEYTPTINSMRSFITKFPALVAAKLRSKITTLDETGQSIADRLANDNPALADHPEIIHVIGSSLHYLYEFRLQLMELKNKDSQIILNGILPDVAEVVYQWCSYSVSKQQIPHPISANSIAWKTYFGRQCFYFGVSTDFEL